MRNRTFVSAALLALSSASAAPAQPMAEILLRLDRFAPTFAGATASIRSVKHSAVLNDDDTEMGVITIKRFAPGKLRFIISFKGDNAYTVVLGDQQVEKYYPKANVIEQYNIRKYRDIAQQLLLLGFGTAGRELAVNYQVRDVRPESIGSQPTTHLELIPKSAEVLKLLTKVELWISDTSQCPVQQKFYSPGGDHKTVLFSDLKLNPILPSTVFDLPKNARRLRMN